MNPTAIMNTDPAEVRELFLRGGHRLLERCYGRSNDVTRQLIAKAGGAALLAERAQVQKFGRRAGRVRAD
jgi:hypothetical protein